MSKFDPANFSDEQLKEIRKELGIRDEYSAAVFVGRMGKEKSVDVMLSYWAKEITAKDHLKLMIIGEGPVKQDLERQVQQLGIQTMVMFAGKVMHEKLPPY